MRKPMSIFGLLQVGGLYLGLMFMIFAILIGLEIMEGSSDINLDPQLTFIVTGSLFLILSIVFRSIEYKKRKIYDRLLTDSEFYKGQVVAIKQFKSVKYRNKSPYVIEASFEYMSDILKGKSNFIWEKPAYEVGDTIGVFIDKENPKIFVIRSM